MNRTVLFTVRLSPDERRQAETVAARMGRTESALYRQLVAEKARRLGIPAEPRIEAQNAT